jgi:hypothetical protein
MKNLFIVVLRKNVTRDIIENIDFDDDEMIEIEMSKNHIKDERLFQNFESDLTFISSQKFRLLLD